jgi:hypothetical protein
MDMIPKRLGNVTKKAFGKLRGKKGRADEDEALPSGQGASFLELPPEIRNAIYEILAVDTALTLYPTKPRKPLTPVALLLACRQTRREFRKLLLANAQILINISEYHFNNLVRVLENLRDDDLDALKLNGNIWILLHISQVPSRDDRKNLRGWVDYRRSDYRRPYFGPNAKAASELAFEYDVRFSPNVRGPRPAVRYSNGYALKMDLLRTHLRMYRRLEVDVNEDRPAEELRKLRQDIEECVRLFEELQMQLPDPPLRSASIATTVTLTSEAGTDGGP